MPHLPKRFELTKEQEKTVLKLLDKYRQLMAAGKENDALKVVSGYRGTPIAGAFLELIATVPVDETER